MNDRQETGRHGRTEARSSVPVISLVVLSLAFALLWVVSTTSGASGDQGEFERPPLAYPKLGTLLNGLAQQSRQSGLAVNSVAEQAPLSQGSAVGVTVYVSGAAGDVGHFLEQNGGRVRHRRGDWLEAFVPVDILGPLSQIPSVRRVRPITRLQEDLGEVVSEAVELHGALGWNRYGFMGSGVKVGIIDVGFGGITGLIGSELPANIRSRCYSLLVGVVEDDLDYCDRAEQPLHGTAVAETIVDVAPDVALYIAAVYTEGDVADAVDWMIDEGVTVINQSLGFSWDGPGDGTSRFGDSILNLVARAAENDILWVNSAGNNAQDTWTGDFTDADADGLMEFVVGDETNRFQMGRGGQFLVELRWDADWGNANTDLDLYLVRVDGDDIDVLTADMIEGYSVDPQSGQDDQDPYEQLTFSVDSSIVDSGDFSLVVKHVRGELPRWVQVRSFFGQNLEHATASGSIGSPAESDSASMLSVGAAPWWNTGEIESFSSQGPTTDGRTKPELVGADRAKTVSYGPQFPGTSQSSPHLAGMAALVRGRYPTITAPQVADYLKSNAEDRGDTGVDNVWGSGFARLPPVDGSPPLSLGDIRLAVADERVAGHLGSAVAFDGETLVVGAELDDGGGGTSSGAVYLYTAPSGAWSDASDWPDPVKLMAPDGMSGDRFGNAAAVDGDTVVVGAPGNDRDGDDAGAAYVFTRAADGWQSASTAKIRLSVSTAAAGDQFGRAVAVDGDTIVIGAPGTDASYVFERPNEGWPATTPAVVLTASDAVTGDAFGRSVSIDADTIVVGAPLAAGPNHADQGAAYLFNKPGDTWATADSNIKLTSATGDDGDRFGFSTNIDRDTIAVGAPTALSRLVLRCGTVHLFTRPVGGWSASSDSFQFSSCDSRDEWFGYSVDVDGDSVIMGFPQLASPDEGAGSAYVLTRTADEWSASSTVTRLSMPGGGTADNAGGAVALVGDHAFVGAPGRQQGVGAVGVFISLEDGWQGGRRFIELAPVGQRFGTSLDVHNGVVVVGAPLARDADDQSTGGVHVFTQPLDKTLVAVSLAPVAIDHAARLGVSTALFDDMIVAGAPGSGCDAGPGRAYAFAKGAGGNWGQATITELSASDGTDGNAFGMALDLDENTLVVGAPGASCNESQAGAAYIVPVTQISGATTTSSIKLTALDAESGDKFGASVAVDGDTVVVGAPGGDGAAYVFTRPVGGWASTSTATKLTTQGGAGSGFGASVAVFGDYVVVGAPLAQNAGGKLGAAYVFEIPSPSDPVELTSPDGIMSERFGAAVAIHDSSIIVGAPGGSGIAVGSGTAYRFTIVDDGISLTSKLMADRYNPGAGFGAAVANHMGKTIVGAGLEERSSGAAYLFGTNHPAQFNEGISAIRYFREDTLEAFPTFVVTVDDPDGDQPGFWWNESRDFQVVTDNTQDNELKVTFAPRPPPNASSTLDYESKNWYGLTVYAYDGADQFGAYDPYDRDDSFTIVINVVDVDEPGVISLSATTPQVGQTLTATVTDPDSVSTPLTNVDWTWQSSTDGGSWTDVKQTTTGANSVDFKPSATLEGKRLRAVAEYDDGHGSGKRAVSDSTAPVAPAYSTPTPVPTATPISQDPGSSAGGGGGGSPRRASTPTPEPVEIRLFGPPEDIPEGESATFTVETTRRLPAALEIEWAVDDGSMAAAADFESTSGAFTLPRGSLRGSSFTFAVPVIDDSLSEQQESFAVSISPRSDQDSEELELVKRRAVANIRESDPLTVLVRGESSVEEGQTVVYAISLAGGLPTADLTIAYELSSGTAEIGSDVEPATGTLTFTPADDALRLVYISTIGDEVVEEPETFTFSLVSVSGGGGPQPSLGDPSSVETTVLDAAPLATPTPVPLAATPTPAPVTPVPAAGARSVVVSVQPNQAVVVESKDSRNRLTIPAASRDAAYQVRLDSDLTWCESAPPAQFIPALCTTVEVFDREGRYEEDVELAEAADLAFNLLPTDVDRLGGPDRLMEVHQAGGLKVLTRDGPDAEWSELDHDFRTRDDGGVSVTVSGITHFSSFALVVHELILGVVPHSGEATATVTPTPVPAPPTATAALTVEPTPVPPTSTSVLLTATAAPPPATQTPPQTGVPTIAAPPPTQSPASLAVAASVTPTATAIPTATFTPAAEPAVPTPTMIAAADTSEPEDEATPLWQLIVVVAFAIMILALGAVALRLRRR